jgi:hypothetical protein
LGGASKQLLFGVDVHEMNVILVFEFGGWQITAPAVACSTNDVRQKKAHRAGIYFLPANS